MNPEDSALVSESGRAVSSEELMDRVLRRTSRLYSLPAVAIEVLRLTEDPRVDVADLKACIEHDPALTAKILRVVNSSLYGLSVEVDNLGQAVALLGIKPLKLLVLGFSLPERLFAELAVDQLERYWATALVRAVAARAIAERFYARAGDDAFVAGLLADLGMLAMLAELGEPYARFLQVIWEREGDVRALERKSLGFDHGQLTAALLAQWKMPASLVRAIADAECPKRSRRPDAEDALPQILYLANLMAGLVGRHRLNVLPELLEAGKAFCGLDKPALNALVEELEPKVAVLADALEVLLPHEGNYLQVLALAQSRLADLGEELAGPLARLDRAEQLLNELKEAQREASQRAVAAPQRRTLRQKPAERSAAGAKEAKSVLGFRGGQALLAGLNRAVAECRACRDELAVAVIGPSVPRSIPERSLAAVLARVSGLIGSCCRAFGVAHAEQLTLGEALQVLILPHCSRHEAIELVRQVLSAIDEGLAPTPVAEKNRAVTGSVSTLSGQSGTEAAKHNDAANLPYKGSSDAVGEAMFCVGVASVDTPPKNFDPARLFEAAQRCFSAAQASGGTVKSIEIY
jgi:HD-like signal output (HDOD) protein